MSAVDLVLPGPAGSAGFREFFHSAPAAVLACDAAGRILAASDDACSLYGYGRNELIGRDAAALGLSATGSAVHRRKDGSELSVAVAARLAEAGTVYLINALDSPPADGRCLRAGVFEMAARGESLERCLGLIVTHLGEVTREAAWSMFLVRSGRLESVVALRLPGPFAGMLDHLPLDAPADGDAIPSPLWNCPPLADMWAHPRWESFSGGASLHGLRGCWARPILSAAGELLGVLAAFLPQLRNPRPAEETLLAEAETLAGIVIEQRNMVEELRYQATHDNLTGLGNRALLEERLEEAIRLAPSGGMVALLRLDLDRFQVVNDLLGQQTGDSFLAEVARLLERCLRHSDTVVRTGGDEFTVLLPALRSAAVAETVAAKVLEQISRPIQVQGHELTVTASIGVAVYPRDASGAQALQAAAEDAMNSCKKRTRNGVVIFDPAESGAVRQRSLIESSLRVAVARQELRLNYQALIDVKSGALVGAEALVRWVHPEIGIVSPGVFIPIAEETGLIHQLGAWVLREACAAAARWTARFGWRGEVSINVSGVQFSHPGFLGVVSSALAETRVNPRSITLEVTETAVLNDLAAAAVIIRKLHNLGLRVSMDDFGTGYASLSYLQNLPFDPVKIDLAFVREIESPVDRPPVLANMLAMIHALGKRAVAEGVETRDQWKALAAMGCDVVQGYLLGRPLPEDVFVANHLQPPAGPPAG